MEIQLTSCVTRILLQQMPLKKTHRQTAVVTGKEIAMVIPFQ